ncbi:MAG: hypothetical protein EBW73_06725 [Betaproteobacteria bacterium]|nr:hypothetical protein [Betaproteobacteria bacterium]NDH28933.1 hypothetical protein [Betaproteobacteria bacterium]
MFGRDRFHLRKRHAIGVGRFAKNEDGLGSQQPKPLALGNDASAREGLDGLTESEPATHRVNFRVAEQMLGRRVIAAGKHLHQRIALF